MRFFLIVSTSSSHSILRWHILDYYSLIVLGVNNSYDNVLAPICSLLDNADCKPLQTIMYIPVFGRRLSGINIDVFESW